MSEILERLAEMDSLLSKRLYGNRALTRDEVDEVIHRHTMLVARLGYVTGQMHGPDEEGEESVCCGARIRFPLPPKRVLREEPDPHAAYVWWKYENDYLWARSQNGAWRKCEAGSEGFVPTPARIDLWHSLKHNPYREVPDNGDE